MTFEGELLDFLCEMHSLCCEQLCCVRIINRDKMREFFVTSETRGPVIREYKILCIIQAYFTTLPVSGIPLL